MGCDLVYCYVVVLYDLNILCSGVDVCVVGCDSECLILFRWCCILVVVVVLVLFVCVLLGELCIWVYDG